MLEDTILLENIKLSPYFLEKEKKEKEITISVVPQLSY